ncbi:MAG: sigma 54-interacting transcriptional regulator [Myxococcaceae bacterium]
MTNQPSVTQSLLLQADKVSRAQVYAWSVEVAAGPDKGRKVRTLDSLVRVGTDPSNDLVLSDPTISRRHAEIERTERGLILRDVGSRNGTVLDGRTIVAAFLKPGDKVLLGKTRIVIKRDAEATDIEVLGADSFGELVGTSEKMRAVFAELRRIAQEDVTLLIEGETGTGKELAARAVHQHSMRRHGPFKVVDCNLISEEAAEQELFGSVSAEGSTPGVFEAAASGTVFLDEIGELPSALQAKLLRVLETREIRRLGETQTYDVDVRIIAATGRNLEEEVRQGRFRSDLYFRLAVAKVRLPPLRTRREDIPVLAQHLLNSLGSVLDLTPQTVALFEGYDWPGNVRELRNVLERGALLKETGQTRWLDFLPQSGDGTSAAPSETPTRSVASMVVGLPYHEAKDRVVGEFERVYFTEVMKEANFDLKIAEEKTGLSMQSLYRLLKKNGLRLKDLKNAEGLEK